MLNRIVLIGRLTRDPELSYTPSSVAVAKFAIAVDRMRKNPETGEKETDFINIVAFQKTADFVSQYVGKGRLVSVDGRLQIRQYVGTDGVKKYFTEVIADSVQGLDRARDGEGSSAYGGEEGGYTGPVPGGPAAAAPARPAAPAAAPPTNDDYDPFADE